MPRTPLKPPARLYARHAAAADRAAWSVERDIRWAEIDLLVAGVEGELHAKLRTAALIESYHPINLGHLLRLLWADVDAGVVLSLEMYEGFKHFHALRWYLDAVGHQPAICDDGLREIRRAEAGRTLDPHDEIGPLVEFMLSEHLAVYFFRRIGEQTREPVLRDLMALIAADEVRHAQSASDLIAKRVVADPSAVARVQVAAAHFHHFGERAVGAVPVAMPGDTLALRTFAARIERLCGVRLVDHLKGALDADDTPRPLLFP